MKTQDIYEMMWNDEKTSDYVMAVAPSKALKYISPDQRERCYIINVTHTRIPSKVHSPVLGGSSGSIGGRCSDSCLHKIPTDSSLPLRRCFGCCLGSCSGCCLTCRVYHPRREGSLHLNSANRLEHRSSTNTTSLGEVAVDACCCSTNIYSTTTNGQSHSRRACGCTNADPMIGHPGGDRSRDRSNEGSSYPRGSGHWLVVTLTGHDAEIFDCLGDVELSTYGEEMLNFTKTLHCSKVNSELLDVVNCGYYCLMFVYHKSRGYSTAECLDLLKSVRHCIKDECVRSFIN